MNERELFGRQIILVEFNIRYLITKSLGIPAGRIKEESIGDIFPGPPSKGP